MADQTPPVDAGVIFDALVLGNKLPLHHLKGDAKAYAASWASLVADEFRSDAADGVKDLQQRAGPRHDFTVVQRGAAVVTVAVPGRFGADDRPVPVIPQDDEDQGGGPRIVYEMLFAQQVKRVMAVIVSLIRLVCFFVSDCHQRERQSCPWRIGCGLLHLGRELHPRDGVHRSCLSC